MRFNYKLIFRPWAGGRERGCEVEAKPAATFTASGGQVFEETWSPTDDRLLVAGLGDGPHLWNVATGELLLAVTHPSLISTVDWSPDGERFVAGSSGGEVLVFDALSGNLLRSTAGHSDEVRSVAYSPDQKLIASGANDGRIRTWTSTDLTPVADTQAHVPFVRSVAWAPDSSRVASGGADGVVRVFDARTAADLGGLADHRHFITKVAYSPDGRLLASSSCDSTVRIWDLHAREYLAVFDEFDGWWVQGMSFSPDGEHLATIEQNGKIRVWDLARRSISMVISAGGFNTTASWSPSGAYLASGGYDGEQVWKVDA